MKRDVSEKNKKAKNRKKKKKKQKEKKKKKKKSKMCRHGFYKHKKKQINDFQDHLERYCNILPVFRLDSAKYDMNFMKKYLLPLLVNGRCIEPIVIKKATQFVSFMFGDVQLLGILNLLGGDANLDFFLKAYKTSKTKSFFP